MNMRTASADGAPEPCRCAPCNPGRMGAAVTPLLIVAIVALNYIPSVLFALDMGIDAATVALVVVFHLLLGLMIVAWSFTCATDPGVPPERWQRQMAGEAAAGREVPRICAKSGLYKPPRSHYCSVTGRLTLNMDHFCPWVVNTVGFYNRKFFVLFLFYACATIFFSAISLGARVPEMAAWAATTDRWLPGVFNVVLIVASLVIDVLLLFVLGPFPIMHVRMAHKNETTIDGSRYPQYDLGAAANLAQVFGRRRWTWLLPCYCYGPDGDGIHWPTSSGGGGGAAQRGSSGGGGGGDMASSPLGAKPSSSEVEMESASEVGATEPV